MNHSINPEINLRERHNLILEALKSKGQVRVIDLVNETGLSAVTIRKDLNVLEQEGLLFRVHGGAVNVTAVRNEHNYTARRSNKKAEKQAIARVVAGLVNDGESLLINVGTTSEYVVDALKGHKNLAVITNALPILEKLTFCENINVFFLGGFFDQSMQITIGDSVIEQLSRYSADKLIMGMDGIDPDYGLTSRNHTEDYVMHDMISRSKEKILIADSSKIGRSSLVRIADITTFDTLVTNSCPEKEDILQRIESMGIRVIRAD